MIQTILGVCPSKRYIKPGERGWRPGVRNWTPEEDVIVASGYANRIRPKEIAKELRRSTTSVHLRASRIGVTIGIPAFGITKEARSASGAAIRAHQAKYGHPKGMLGKRHTEKMKTEASVRGVSRWKSMTKKQQSEFVMRQLKGKIAKYGTLVPTGNRQKATWKAAWREIGGMRKFYRSRWEANYARFLEWQKQQGLISAWEHEPETFWFEKILRGARSYLPDFRVTSLDGSIAYHEVKGWMDPASKTKLKRMKKYYPKVKVELIDTKRYNTIKRQVSGIIVGWE